MFKEIFGKKKTKIWWKQLEDVWEVCDLNIYKVLLGICPSFVTLQKIGKKN